MDPLDLFAELCRRERHYTLVGTVYAPSTGFGSLKCTDLGRANVPISVHCLTESRLVGASAAMASCFSPPYPPGMYEDLR